jgi:hypothetical protein
MDGTDRPKRNPRRRHSPAGKIMVPVGIEKILYRAAGDVEFRKELLGDRERAVAASGMTLRESERAVLRAVPDDALAAMIDRVPLANPKRRRFMNAVAAAVTSLAAGTAAMGCDEVETRQYNADAGGCDADCDVDSDSDTDEDAGPDGGPDAGDTDSD